MSVEVGMRLWGAKEEPVDPEAVKARSMAEVERRGGRTNPSLPIIDPTPARTGEDLARRALVLNALVGLAYEAEVPVLRDWIEANGLTHALSPKERALLAKATESLTERDVNDAGWGMEALFALLWAGGLVPDLGIETPISMESLARLPKVGKGESGRAFAGAVRLRPYAELFAALDLYYRAHWYARDAGLQNEDAGAFSIDVIMERRKALEWLLDARLEWDEVSLDT